MISGWRVAWSISNISWICTRTWMIDVPRKRLCGMPAHINMLCHAFDVMSDSYKHLVLTHIVGTHPDVNYKTGSSHVAPRIPIALYSCPWLVSICSQRATSRQATAWTCAAPHIDGHTAPRSVNGR